MDSEAEMTSLYLNPASEIGSECHLSMLVVGFGMFHAGKEMMLVRKLIASFILEKNG